MEISAQQVMALREKTGVSMMAVKKALQEANGDEDKAIEILRKRGEAKSSEKADRTVREGVITMSIKGGRAALGSLRCETDFVGRNEDFLKLAQTLTDIFLENGEEGLKEQENLVKEAVNTLGENIQMGEFKKIEAPVIAGYIHTNRKIGVLVGLDTGTEEQAKNVAMHAAAMNPKVISPDEIAADLVSKEKEIWKEQLKAEGKPENILENIMKGKEKKFREEHALLTQLFVKDPSKTIGQYLGQAKPVQYIRMVI